jgi:hypothetical protein
MVIALSSTFFIYLDLFANVLLKTKKNRGKVADKYSVEFGYENLWMPK